MEIFDLTDGILSILLFDHFLDDVAFTLASGQNDLVLRLVDALQCQCYTLRWSFGRIFDESDQALLRTQITVTRKETGGVPVWTHAQKNDVQGLKRQRTTFTRS